MKKYPAVVSRAGEGEQLEIQESTVTFRLRTEQSDQRLGVYEIDLQPGMIGANPHYHSSIDETFVVLDGEVVVEVGHETQVLNRGDLAFVPRTVVHAFRNESHQRCRILLFFSPGKNREGFFYGLKELLEQEVMDMDLAQRINSRYDNIMVEK